MSGQLIYVNRRPCGCRHSTVTADVFFGPKPPRLKITEGWSLQASDAVAAERMPTACDTCAPVRQVGLFDAPPALATIGVGLIGGCVLLLSAVWP